MTDFPFHQTGDPDIPLDLPVEFSPVLLADQADERTAAQIAQLLSDMLADDLPDDLHDDIRDRLSDLARRFPAQVTSPDA